MQLGVRAPMCSLTGYAEFAREVVSSLCRHGVEVSLELLDQPLYKSAKEYFPQSVVGLIKRLQRPIPDSIPILTIGTPPQYDSSRGSLKIGVGLFEAFGVPQAWLTSLSSMDLVLTLSEFNKEVFARHGIARKKIELIPPAIDCVRFHPSVQPFYIDAVRPFTILFVGQLILRKGWDKLLIAALRTFRMHTDVCVILKLPPVRSTAQRQLAVERIREVKKEAGSSKVPVYVNDYAIPIEQVPRVYQAIRKKLPDRRYRFLNGEPPRGIFALPSLGEGIGLPYLEAQASGLLALGTRSTGQEFLNPSNAIIVKSGPPVRNIKFELEHTLYRGAPFPAVTVEAVSEALQRAYDISSAERVKIERRARLQAERLTYNKCVEKIISIIESRM